MPNEPKQVCPRCQIGMMQPKRIPYSMIENGNLVSVAKMPARVCDVCGNRAYDREPLVNLRTMLGAARRKTKPALPKKTANATKSSTPRKTKS